MKAGKMKRNLKVLGLALTAVFAMSALSAAGASAQSTFNYGSATGALTASAVTTQEFVTVVDKLNCTNVATDTNTSKFTSASETYATVKPLYTGCKAVTQNLNTVVDFTKCHYKFAAHTTGEHANVDIVCDSPSEKPHIKAVVLGFQLNCVTVEQQTVNGVRYTSTTSGGKTDVNVKATVTGIKYTVEGVCHEGSEPTTFSNGTYNGEVTVKAENTSGEQVDGSWKE
jgi:hypothetical protein